MLRMSSFIRTMDYFRKGLHLLFFLMLLPLGISCCDEEREGVFSEHPDRTILVYMIGDNNLWPFSDQNIGGMIEGMKNIHTTAHLLVYEDSNNHPPILWEISRKENDSVYAEIEFEYEEQNSADPAVIKTVLNDAFRNFPSKEKGLILWSHGNGWLPTGGDSSYGFSRFLSDIQRVRRKSIGPDKNEYLEIWDLRESLESTGLYFDFICFDACLMASVEVVYEMKDLTANFLASPTEIMGSGFPYSMMIPAMMKNEINYATLCDLYMQYYDGRTANRCGSISWVQTAGLSDLAETYRETIAGCNMSREQILACGMQQMGRLMYRSNGIVKDYTNIFFDLRDWMLHLSQSPERIDELLRRIVAENLFTSKFGISINGGEIIDINRCCGLTVFIPEVCHNQIFLTAYKKLRWYKDVVYR